MSAGAAFDRGRAVCKELLSLCRVAAAYQLAAAIVWVVRYLESKRNPTDHDSRLADAGLIRAGEVRSGPRLLHTAAPPGLGGVQAPRPARLLPFQPPKFFLELFAGCCRLTGAVLSRGLRVAQPVELEL
eukprot:6806369-Lingulodinium_polyedra.AAC.1